MDLPRNTGVDRASQSRSGPARHTTGCGGNPVLTSNPIHAGQEGRWSPLQTVQEENYDDLTTARMTPLMFLVLELPSDEEEWLECSAEHLTRRAKSSPIRARAADRASPRRRGRGCGARCTHRPRTPRCAPPAEAPQDEDVLGPVGSGAVLDCGPPPGDVTLDLCTVPALGPIRPILSVCLDEGVGNGMDEVGVCRHVALPCQKAAPCRLDSRWLHVGRTSPVAGRGTLRCREW